MDLRGVPYPGHKSSFTGLAQWVNSILPIDKDATYVEPFAGMLGVLLDRLPSKVEIINDTNDRVVNWWQVVRDKPEELYHKCYFTPFADKTVEYASSTIDEGTDVERAWKWFVIANCTYGSFGPRKKLGVTYANSGYTANRARAFERWLEQSTELANRMRNVQITHRDGNELLAKTASMDYAIVYCDPPYYSRRQDIYKENNAIDIDQLTESLSNQEGRAAISGVDTEWDHLNWDRHEKHINRAVGQGRRRADTEVLWVNFEIDTQGRLGA